MSTLYSRLRLFCQDRAREVDPRTAAHSRRTALHGAVRCNPPHPAPFQTAHHSPPPPFRWEHPSRRTTRSLTAMTSRVTVAVGHAHCALKDGTVTSSHMGKGSASGCVSSG